MRQLVREIHQKIDLALRKGSGQTKFRRIYL